MTERFSLSHINLIRGFLAMYVFVGHCAHLTGASIKPLPGPGHAVDVFMILSGFLMALNYHQRESAEPWEKRTTILMFYMRRFFRIAPVYYLCLIIAFVFIDSFNVLMGIYPGQTNSSWGPQMANFTTNHVPLAFLLHITFLFGLIPTFIQDTVLPDWSIGLEMQFYAVFPLLMLLIKRIGYLIPMVVFSIVYVVAPGLFGEYETAGTLLHFGLPAFLPLKINVFLIGILLGKAKFYFMTNDSKMAMKLLFFVLILSMIGNGFMIFASTIYFVIWVFASTDIAPVFFKNFYKTINSISDNRLVNFFSDTSYSVYLVHLFVLHVMNGMLVTRPFYIQMSYMGRFGFMLLCSFPIIYFISYWVFRLIERPFIRIGKKVDSIFPTYIKMEK